MTREVITVSLVHLRQGEKSMLVTAEVLKKFGPKMREVKDEQPMNIKSMFVTAEVSKLDKSRDVKEIHIWNIA